MVRLKVNDAVFAVLVNVKFQFLMVRLKGNQPTDYHFLTLYFNSLWCD